MRQIPAGAFKARCLTVMKQVQSTGEPVVVTKRGTPLVKVVPVREEKNEIFGFLAGKVKIVGDIESRFPLTGAIRKRDFARYACAGLADQRAWQAIESGDVSDSQSESDRGNRHLGDHVVGVGVDGHAWAPAGRGNCGKLP